MNIQWGLDSATVERNSSMCGEHHMICNGEKKCASHYARLSFFFGGGGGENFGKYAIRNWKLSKIQIESFG